MTPDEIDAMPAGREMDALVAEKIMGWKFQKPQYGRCCTCQRCGRPHDECEGSCKFSENIADAMGEVVEKLVFEGFDAHVSISSKLANDDPERAYCDFQSGDDNAAWRSDYALFQAWASTVSLAICRAALKARLHE